MNYTEIRCPELLVQVAGMPDEGRQIEGDVPFSSLELESDERFHLTGLLHFSLRLSPVKSDLLVTGCLSATVEALCDRCVEWGKLELNVPELFHRYRMVSLEPIDLTEDIREDILLAFPQTYLCREDCKGLCPSCGSNLNEGSCGCAKQPDDSEFTVDDRKERLWAALDKLDLKDSEP